MWNYPSPKGRDRNPMDGLIHEVELSIPVGTGLQTYGKYKKDTRAIRPRGDGTLILYHKKRAKQADRPKY